jgi:hypothetical protein
MAALGSVEQARLGCATVDFAVDVMVGPSAAMISL